MKATGKAKLKPSRRLAKQLRGASKGKATVVLNATDAAGNLRYRRS